MGDRTHVTLMVLELQVEQAVELMAFQGTNCGPITDGEHGTFRVFCFEEVNYGQLDFLKELRGAGIAFDSHWESGHSYGPGTHSCRFTVDGECDEREITHDQLSICVETLAAKILNQPYEQVKAFILQRRDEITPLPFDENQIEYGKRYLTRTLIAPA